MELESVRSLSGVFGFNGKSARGQKATGGMVDRSNHGMGRR